MRESSKALYISIKHIGKDSVENETMEQSSWENTMCDRSQHTTVGVSRGSRPHCRLLPQQKRRLKPPSILLLDPPIRKSSNFQDRSEKILRSICNHVLSWILLAAANPFRNGQKGARIWSLWFFPTIDSRITKSGRWNGWIVSWCFPLRNERSACIRARKSLHGYSGETAKSYATVSAGNQMITCKLQSTSIYK